MREPGRICLVTGTPGTGEPAGGHAVEVARLLSSAGWRVHILECDPEGNHPIVPRDERVSVTRLADLPLPAALGTRSSLEVPALDVSDQVAHAVRELDEREGLDLVEFAGRGAPGFRAVQSRRAALALEGVGTIVRAEGSSELARERDGAMMRHFTDAVVDFAERYTFEHADFRCALDPSMSTELAARGWRVGDDMALLPRLQVGEGPDSAAGPVLDFYAACLDAIRAGAAADATRPSPLVTVVVPYYQLPEFLPETLRSLAAQTYAPIEVIVIDDGSTDPESVRVFREQESTFPDFRFLRQDNVGPAATRNRGLAEARGEYFLPVDADDLAAPDMVATFVRGMEHNPGVSALSSYALVFRDAADIERGTFLWAQRPTAGPHIAASFWNVYGSGNAIFRTRDLRAVGGYEPERDAGWEDWELFVKLANAGREIAVVPDYLFYYRFRDDSTNRRFSWFRNHQRVIRQFYRLETLAPAERRALWSMLVSMKMGVERLSAENETLRRKLVAADGGPGPAQRGALPAMLETLRKELVRLTAENAKLRRDVGGA